MGNEYPQLKTAGAWPFVYGDNGLVYGIEAYQRATIRQLRAACNPSYLPAPQDSYWYLAQLRLYGVSSPVKKGRPMREAMREALENGLLDKPSDQMQKLEQDLKEKYDKYQTEFNGELQAWKARREAVTTADNMKEMIADTGKEKSQVQV